MSIIKNEIPILEFDSERSAVIDPDHEKLSMALPEKALFAFLGALTEEYAIKNGGKKVGEFESATKRFPIYIINHKGEDICLCQAPVGSAPAAQLMDWLIGYGAKKIISTGCCGALRQMPENMFLIPTRALRDEGTSYHYLPPSRYVDLSPIAAEAIKKALTDQEIEYREVTTWTTDGFYRETPEKVSYRRNEGCDVVEMECAALAACAKFRGALWGCMLFTGDTLANIHAHDPRNWGADSHSTALALCLDALLYL